jgi:hypothetical protein
MVDGIDLLFAFGAGEPREDGAPLRVVLYEMPACLVMNRGLDGKLLGFRIFIAGDGNYRTDLLAKMRNPAWHSPEIAAHVHQYFTIR